MHVERAAFANEPMTVTTHRDGRVERTLGGPNARGGTTYAFGKPFWTTVSPQGTWAASSLPVPLYVALPKSRDLGDDEDAEIEVAARAWAGVTCSAFRAHVAGTTTIGPGDDGTSGVYFEDAAWPSEFTPGAIATTVVHVDAQGHIYDADVYVNGADHVFSLDARAATIDFRSIATHEIGHVLGLGESADPIATMYTSYPLGVSWRSLEQDDDDGACALYPGMGDLLGCEATPCPSDFVCVARACERLGDQRMTCSPCKPTSVTGCEGAGNAARCVELADGYACARPCKQGDDCGAHFSCMATTAAGDWACVANDGCTNAANPCTTSTACKDLDDAGWICGGGACLGAVADAGSDAPIDATSDAGEIITARGGCDCASVPTRNAPTRVTFLAYFALIALAIARNGRARG